MVKPRKLPATERALTGRELRFCELYMQTRNATDSYRQVWKCDRLSQSVIANRARVLLARPLVQQTIDYMAASMESEFMYGVKEVMREWLDIATADPNEIVSVEIQCCRYCYGHDHHYQWTERELAEATASAIQSGKQLPDDRGGVGFNFTLPPVKKCPECHGTGHPTVVMHDTTKLTGKARKLYAGVKQTKDGVQILMRDQDAAMANFAKALGMFQEVVKLEAHLTHRLAQPLSHDPQEASNTYRELMEK